MAHLGNDDMPYMENQSFCVMDAEEPFVRGNLVRGQVIIGDPMMQNALQARGFGDSVGKRFVLTQSESLYLVYVRRLDLRYNGSLLSFDALVPMYKKSDHDILTKFLVYRDLRTRGYVVKDGFGFGSDFRVYEKGHFGKKGAKYLVFALNEGRQEKIGTLYKKISEISQMGKEPIIAVLERRGEVIYYKISGMNFLQNKFEGMPVS